MAVAASSDYGGYEYVFVEPLHNRCICNICQHPSRDAYMTGQCCQGQTICKSCLYHWQAKKSGVCPVCRKEGSITTYPNYPVDREVRSSHVYCTNKHKGCDWQGEVNDINNHLVNTDGCQFVKTKCSYGCGKVMQRRHLVSHLTTKCPYRKVNCQYCHITGEHQFIEGEHQEECSRYPLPCPNNCEVGTVPRREMDRHKGECPLEEVICSNNCNRKVKRRYLASHVKTECPCRKVTCQYCQQIKEHWFINGQHIEECLKLPVPCPNGCEVGTIPREDMERHKNECQLEVVSCSYNCGERLERQYMMHHVGMECPRRNYYCEYCYDIGEHRYIEGEHKDECTKFPLPCPNGCEVGTIPREDMKVHRQECPLEMVSCEYHSVGCLTKMLRKDQEGHKKEKIEEHLMMTMQKLTTNEKQLTDTKLQLAEAFLELDTTKTQLTDALQRINVLEAYMNQATYNTVFSPSVSDEAIELNWSDKLASARTVLKSNDQQYCPVLLRMSGYNEKKKKRVEWYSDSFYTHSNGYRISLCVFAAGCGDGEGTHLSVSLYLMKGKHDDQLTWPLRGKFKVKLLNQISDSEHYSKIFIFDDKTPNDNAGRVTEGDKADGWGFHMFISNEELHKTTTFRKTNTTCQYLKDDCILFKVTVVMT